MKNKQRGFVIPIIIAIVALLAIGSGYVYYKNNDVKTTTESPLPNMVDNLPTASSTNIVTTPPSPIIQATTPDWKKYSDASFSFEYPALLSMKKNGETITLDHSIPHKHPNHCDFVGNLPPLENLTDFGLVFQVIDKNLSEYIGSKDFPGPNYVFSNPFSINSLNGYEIMIGVEGCGNYTYYFPISQDKTLIVTRSLISEFISTVTEDRQKYLNLPGIISPDQEENYFNQILSTLKLTTVPIDLINLSLYIQDRSYVATSSCSVTKKVIYKVPKTTAVADASLRILFSDELSRYGKYKSVSIVNGIAKIVVEEIKSGLSSCESSHLFAVLKDTLTQYSSIKSVELVRLDGSTIQF